MTTQAAAKEYADVLDTINGHTTQLKELRKQKKACEEALLESMENEEVEELELPNGTRITLASTLHLEKPNGRRKRQRK
jgi:hypothetical protein